LYAAICLSVPFLLFQIWAFVSPGLYPHERGYVTPFIFLSSVSFVIGAAFAYYILFPPAAKYLLGLGQDFRLLLKADDYFDFIILVMLGMGLVFQMPAITYVLARIGIVNADSRLEDCCNRYSDSGRRPVSDERHSEHDAVCGAHVRALFRFNFHRLDLWETPHRVLTGFTADSVALCHL
jgi:hypothetical protein